MADWKVFILLVTSVTIYCCAETLERYMDNAVYCSTDTLIPTCPGQDEVVVITEATYGVTTRNNKCGYEYSESTNGCRADVIQHVHSMCSGRYTCEVKVPNEEMEALNQCEKKYKVYLNVTYKCLKVETTACHPCLSSPGQQATLTGQEGYLSSIVTYKTYQRCGTHECPWSIEVKPGQKINLSMLDFGGSGNLQYDLLDTCPRNAEIREAAAPRNTPVCAGGGFHRTIYTSVSNSLQISFVRSEVNAKRGQFLIHYEALGCPDMPPPPNTQLKRSDSQLKITCETTGETWELTCVGHEWKGDSGSCSGAGTASPIVNAPTSLDIPIGVLIAIVIGIALVIGSLILTVGIVCLKRHHSHQYGGQYYFRTHGHDYDYPLEMLGAAPGELYIAPKTPHTTHEPSKYQPVMLPGKNTGVQQTRNWYQRKQDVQNRPLPSLPNIAEASGSASTLSRSDDDPQTVHTAADVHCTSAADRERRYLTNPRPASARSVQSAPGTGAAMVPGNKPNRLPGQQYFMLENQRNQRGNLSSQQQNPQRSQAAIDGGRTESKSDDPNLHRLLSARLSLQSNEGQLRGSKPPPGMIQSSTGKSGVAGGNNKGPLVTGTGSGIGESIPGHKPEIAPKPKLKLDISSAHNVPGSCVSTSTAGHMTPEQENAENDGKESSGNTSCHEIPLRPSRFTAHNVNNTRAENITGKTSWP